MADDKEIGISEGLARELIRAARIVLSSSGDRSNINPLLRTERRRMVELEAYAGGVAGEYKATLQRKTGTGTWAAAASGLTFDPDLAASPTNIASPVRELNDIAGLEGKIVSIEYVADTNEAGRWVFSVGSEAGAEVTKVKILSHVGAGQYGGVEMELDGSNSMVTKPSGITFGSGGGEVLLFALNKVTDFPLGIIVHAVRNDNTDGTQAWTFEDDWTIGETPGDCTDTVYDLLVRVRQTGGGNLIVQAFLASGAPAGNSVFNTDVAGSWDCDSTSPTLANNNTCDCQNVGFSPGGKLSANAAGTCVVEDNDDAGAECADCSPASITPSAVTCTFSGIEACSDCFDCNDSISSAKVLSLSFPAVVICTQTGGDACIWEATVANVITVRQCTVVDCGE